MPPKKQINEQNEITLSPQGTQKALLSLVQSKQSVCLWGSPGIGKSQVVKGTAKSLEIQCIDVRAVLLDPVDLRGLPHISEGKSKWAIPDFLPKDGEGILFLDELNRAPSLVQNACFQLVLDRALGEYRLPDGWAVVSACNRESDGGGISRMSSALANRFVHINVEADHDEWTQWALQAGIEPLVIAFLRFKPENFNAFDKNEKAFPTPRSWEMVSGICKASTGGTLPQEIAYALYAGAVGKGAGGEFTAYEKMYRQLPTIEEVILSPKTARVPTEPSALYAISAAIGGRINRENIDAFLVYLARMQEVFSVVAIKDAVMRYQGQGASADFTHSPGFLTWAERNSQLLLG